MIVQTIIDTVSPKEPFHIHIHKETIAVTAKIVNSTHLLQHLKVIDTRRHQIAHPTAMDKVVIR